MNRSILLFVVMHVGSAIYAQTYSISTIAGGAVPNNVPAQSIGLSPSGLALDNAENIFLTSNDTVYRVDAKSGLLTVIAGNGTAGFSGDDGAATSAQLNGPRSLASTADGALYIGDAQNNRVRKIFNGVISTLAIVDRPYLLASDRAGNVYASEDSTLKKISPNGTVTTLTGGGQRIGSCISTAASSAQFGNISDIAVDSNGNVYVADSANGCVEKLSNGLITNVAGGGSSGDNGPATSAATTPCSVAVDSAGTLYILECWTGRIRKVSNGIITTIAGGGSSTSDGPAAAAFFNGSDKLQLSASGTLYLTDSGRIRKIVGGDVVTIAGNGRGDGFSGDGSSALQAMMSSPEGVAIDANGAVYVADFFNNLVRKIQNGIITTVAGGGTGSNGQTGRALDAILWGPNALAVDAAGDIFISEYGNEVIRKVSNGTITTVAGNGKQGFSGDGGLAINAAILAPRSIAIGPGGTLYIAADFRVRMVKSGIISTVAGNGSYPSDNLPLSDGSSALSAGMMPSAIAVDPSGSLYIGDSYRGVIVKVSNGTISTLAGGGKTACGSGPALSVSIHPSGIAIGSDGSIIFADLSCNSVRKLASGVITTIAGTGQFGYQGDGGPSLSAFFGGPSSVALNASGSIYVADYNNRRIRLLTPNPLPSISRNGIVPVYSSSTTIQSGSWVSIYGANLADGTYLWSDNYPVSLGETQVFIDNKPAYLWLVSPTQINAQVPDIGRYGAVEVMVKSPFGVTTSIAILAEESPAFSLLGDARHIAGEILTNNGSGAYGGGRYDLVGPSGAFSYATRPVAKGEILSLFGVGFGPTKPFVPAGSVFSGAAATVSPVTITIDNISFTALFAGLIQSGLYQINIIVPEIVSSGDKMIMAQVNGVSTQTGVVVTVK